MVILVELWNTASLKAWTNADQHFAKLVCVNDQHTPNSLDVEVGPADDNDCLSPVNIIEITVGFCQCPTACTLLLHLCLSHRPLHPLTHFLVSANRETFLLHFAWFSFSLTTMKYRSHSGCWKLSPVDFDYSASSFTYASTQDRS